MDTTVTRIDISITILKRGTMYGYELRVGPQTAKGWEGERGEALLSATGAWRVAMRRIRDRGLKYDVVV